MNQLNIKTNLLERYDILTAEEITITDVCKTGNFDAIMINRQKKTVLYDITD